MLRFIWGENKIHIIKEVKIIINLKLININGTANMAMPYHLGLKLGYNYWDPYQYYSDNGYDFGPGLKNNANTFYIYFGLENQYKYGWPCLGLKINSHKLIYMKDLKKTNNN